MMTIPVKGTHIMRKHPKPMPEETRALLAFAFSFVSLCGYCYKLVQIRNYEIDRSYGEQAWFNAA